MKSYHGLHRRTRLEKKKSRNTFIRCINAWWFDWRGQFKSLSEMTFLPRFLRSALKQHSTIGKKKKKNGNYILCWLGINCVEYDSSWSTLVPRKWAVVLNLNIRLSLDLKRFSCGPRDIDHLIVLTIEQCQIRDFFFFFLLRDAVLIEVIKLNYWDSLLTNNLFRYVNIKSLSRFLLAILQATSFTLWRSFCLCTCLNERKNKTLEWGSISISSKIIPNY